MITIINNLYSLVIIFNPAAVNKNFPQARLLVSFRPCTHINSCIKINKSKFELSKLRLVNSHCFSKDDVKKWLKSFCNGDALNKDFQRHIINAFINSIYLFDDKIIIYYNLKNSKQVTYFEMLEGAVKNSRQKERLQVTEKGMLAVVFVV